MSDHYQVGMSPQITTKLGVLQGKKCEDFFGKQYYSFQGIPFAKPPLGNLRFKAPQPPEPWKGVRDATKEQEGCFCYDVLLDNTAGKEDCLYLNVYTPQIPSDRDFFLKPVMVYIHGGGFTSGSGTEALYGPKYLITQDVVLVTINYRVGALGFLSLQDVSLEVPGNAGLKDQVMALKWIQDNIKYFGGNPDNVTIFGESAGSASVHFLVISRMAKGLFHKAIMQSGTAFDGWAMGKPTGLELAPYMNIKAKGERELLKILQEVPVDDILSAQLSMKDVIDGNFVRSFVPVVEKPNKNAFLDEDPVDLLIQGRYNKVPIILGYTSREGIICEYVPYVTMKGRNLENFIPYKIHVDEGSPLAINIAKKIKEFYFPNNAKVEGDRLYQLDTDVLFYRGIHKSTKYHSLTSPHPVYLYRFSMDGKLNLIKDVLKITNRPGACHADDLGYLFTNQFNKEVPKDSQEYKGMMTMIRYWTNFAKTGNPNATVLDDVLNIEWKPVDKEKIHFMDLDFDLKSGEAPEKERMALWDEIYNMKSSTIKY